MFKIVDSLSTPTSTNSYTFKLKIPLFLLFIDINHAKELWGMVKQKNDYLALMKCCGKFQTTHFIGFE